MNYEINVAFILLVIMILTLIIWDDVVCLWEYSDE